MRILIAALAGITLATCAPAAFAQPYDHGPGYGYQGDHGEWRAHHDRRWERRHYGWRRGHHYGWRHRERVCFWRYGERICHWRRW